MNRQSSAAAKFLVWVKALYRYGKEFVPVLTVYRQEILVTQKELEAALVRTRYHLSDFHGEGGGWGSLRKS